jgi:hypothetical protein
VFYTFIQNNSGGTWRINKDVSKFVIIEADSVDDANDLAEEKAKIYFDGCAAGIDCDCCGDRWYPVREYDAAETPMIYDQAAEHYSPGYGWGGERDQWHYCHIYYRDGMKRTLYPPVGDAPEIRQIEQD